MIRVLLVDDQKMIREALKVWLEPEADLQVIGTADNGISAVEQVEKLKPDIVIMNMEMPGLDGASATQFITNKFADTKVVILSSDDSDEYVIKSLSVGAKGYLLKNNEFQDIASAIRSVHKGYTQIAPGLIEKLLIQTDSGTVLSKFGTSTISEMENNPEDKPSTNVVFFSKVKRSIANLQSVFRQQKGELDQLQIELESTQTISSKNTRDIAKQAKYFWLTWLLLLIFLPLFCFGLFNLYRKSNKLQNQVQELENNTIPIERIGMNGEYDLSGLAQRVAKTLGRDKNLSGTSKIHVSQNGSTILLSGRVENINLIPYMAKLAKDVTGVENVDTSQVEVLSGYQIDSEQLSL